MKHDLLSRLNTFDADVIFISAGFDGHAGKRRIRDTDSIQLRRDTDSIQRRGFLLFFD